MKVAETGNRRGKDLLTRTFERIRQGRGGDRHNACTGYTRGDAIGKPAGTAGDALSHGKHNHDVSPTVR